MEEVVVGDLEKFIAEISKHIGLEWKSLARALGFEQTDIDAIEYKDVRNLKEQIFQMFHEWKRNNGSGATTTRLLSAIKHAELNKLLKTLREKAFIVPTLRGSADLASSLAAGKRFPIQATDDAQRDSPAKLKIIAKSPPASAAQAHKDTEPSPDQAQMNLEELKCGDVVRLKSRNESVVAVSGVIKWIGEHHSRGILAGIELWEKMEGASDGRLEGVQYFSCDKGYGIFFPLDALERDERFSLPSKGAEQSQTGGAMALNSVPPPTSSKEPICSQFTAQESPLPVTRMSQTSAGNSKTAIQRAHSAATTNMQSLLKILSDVEPKDSRPALMFYVPGDQVGILIGKDGKNIQEVQSETNTIIKVPRKREDTNISENVSVSIRGNEENQKKALFKILQNLKQKIEKHIAMSETMIIPNSKIAGLVIGKNGTNRKLIEEMTGAKLKIINPEAGSNERERKCVIRGTAEQIEEAKEFVELAMRGEDIATIVVAASLLQKLLKYFEEKGFLFPDNVH